MLGAGVADTPFPSSKEARSALDTISVGHGEVREFSSSFSMATMYDFVRTFFA